MLDRSNTTLRTLGHFSKCRRNRHEGCWDFNSVSPRLKGHVAAFASRATLVFTFLCFVGPDASDEEEEDEEEEDEEGKEEGE
jgi:hypothetical protein